VPLIPPTPADCPPTLTGAPPIPLPTATRSHEPDEDDESVGPKASLTDPEAQWMLATSRKRWEPSFNADIAVTRDWIIVSQFLTKNPTDYPNFAPALQGVLVNLGRPEGWVGDGHYGTHANLVLADREGVTLYAPGASGASTPTGSVGPVADKASVVEAAGAGQPDNERKASKKTVRFGRKDFQHDPDRNLLICPAKQELPLIGTYGKGVWGFRLYGRSDCGACPLKAQCTQTPGRRVKRRIGLERPTLPVLAPTAAPGATADVAHKTAVSSEHLTDLLRARDKRMLAHGNDFMRMRRETVEPVHAQLRQHGLSRLHVRGRARGGAVLTLCCIAHNLMKWKARGNARALGAAA
jgi:hypothetical protein